MNGAKKETLEVEKRASPERRSYGTSLPKRVFNRDTPTLKLNNSLKHAKRERSYSEECGSLTNPGEVSYRLFDRIILLRDVAILHHVGTKQNDSVIDVPTRCARPVNKPFLVKTANV